MNQETFEDELTALFAEVEAPPSVASWRERIAKPTSVLEDAPVVRPLVFEPKGRRPVTAWQRVAAAWVAVLAIGFAVVGVITSDRVLSPPPRPDITQSITDHPTGSPSAPSSPPQSIIGFAPSGQPPASGQPGGGGGGRPPARGQQPPATSGDPPVAPALGPLADWPDAANTGVPPGTVLGEQAGDLHVTTPGAIVHDLRVDGRIFVEAPDVTLRRVVVVTPFELTDPTVWQLPSAPRLRIEDSEVSARYAVRQEAIGLTVQRSDLSGLDVVVGLRGGGVTIVDSYLHGSGPVESAGNLAGVALRHNNVFGTVSLTDQDGPVTDVVIDNNQLGGGSGVVIFAPSGPGSRGIQVLGNQFRRNGGSVTPASGWDGQAPGNAWTGNVWLGTTDPVNP